MKRIILFLILICNIGFSNEIKPRILVGSPIQQKPSILSVFLNHLSHIESEEYILDYFFVDDNVDPFSKSLLQQFKLHCKSLCIIKPSNETSSFYCNEYTHYWTNDLVWKVGSFKDDIIHYAKENEYDYLFLVDSDIILHPETINQLIKAKKPIISNIFWTAWQPGTQPLPQVWISDTYTLYHYDSSENLTHEEINKRTDQFLSQLKIPGVYEVGGLGACTLINKFAIHKGISFKRIKNITLWGEDRHFCVRALALDIPLFVDTHYPAYHIYRISDLEGVNEFCRSFE